MPYSSIRTSTVVTPRQSHFGPTRADSIAGTLAGSPTRMRPSDYEEWLARSGPGGGGDFHGVDLNRERIPDTSEYTVNSNAPWIHVTSSLAGPNTPSSNVEAIRWVGGYFGLQVWFKAKGKWPASFYEYAVPKDVYDDMVAAQSKGQFVWHILRADRVPYHRIG